MAILGTPLLTGEQGEVSITRRQPRALLYRLGAAAGPLAREQLAFLLWPDLSTATARRNLVVALNQLRSALPSGVIITTGDTVSLDWGLVWCDAREFGQFSGTSGTVDLIHLERTVALYRGPFVEGFVLPDAPEFDAWLTAERAAWERRYLQALAALVEHATSEGRYRIAIDAARRYLLTDPFAEALHRCLIGLLAAVDDRTAALRQFEWCAEQLEYELGVEPAPETVAAYEAVREGRQLLPPRAERPEPAAPVARDRAASELSYAAKLPVPTTPLFGRAGETAALAQLLHDPPIRLLTVAGMGGSGKTRLALHVAEACRVTFADGVHFVALAPLRDPAQFMAVIAQACGVRDGVEAGGSLREYLRDKRLLLVLDNFEHLVPASPAIADLLAWAPHVKVLVTSRTALNVQGEHVFALPPLPLPPLDPLPPIDELAEQPALALLLERARAAGAPMELSADNAASLAAICIRLDGLPLAIELAAARLRLLAPHTLLRRLDQRLALLTGGPRDLPERQQTLRATIDWSYRLLDVAEQLLLERLAVFAGSWSVEAAEHICVAAGELSVSVLDGIQALLDQHLLQRSTGAGGDMQFSMLETIREYATERLHAGRAAEVTEHAHARYMCDLAGRGATGLRGTEASTSLPDRPGASTSLPDRPGASTSPPERAGQRLWLARLADEYPNLLAAIEWSDHAGEYELGLRLTAALREFWRIRGMFDVGRRLLERALQAGADTGISTARAAALHAAADLVLIQGDYPAARAYADAGAEQWRYLGDEAQLARILMLASSAAAFSGDTQAGIATQADAEVLAERTGDSEALLLIHYSKARDALHRGDAHAAREWYARALAEARRMGNGWWIGGLQSELAPVSLALGDVETARDQITESIALASSLGDRYATALAINNLGEAARMQGEYREAATCYAESLRRFQDLGDRSETPRLLHNLGYVALWEDDPERAGQLFGDSIERFRAQRSERGVAEALAGLAAVAAVQGRWQHAARLWGQAEALREAAGAAPWPADQLELRRYVALARAAADAATFDAAWQAGRELSLDAVLVLAD